MAGNVAGAATAAVCEIAISASHDARCRVSRLVPIGRERLVIREQPLSGSSHESHAAILGRQDLGAIAAWRLHELKGDQAGRWSITVNGNWRLTFTFEQTDVVLLDYEDYH